MKVLLSIKPEYADKIFSGEKKYEFRRTIFKDERVKTVIVYASSPVKKVIGEFDIDDVIREDIPALWKKTKKGSGISFNFFKSYFSDKEQGYAIKVKNYKKYDVPKCIKSDFNAKPPQSFLYIKEGTV